MFEALLANRTVSVLWEALPRILTAGLTMTIPLTLISFSLAMVIAVAVALVQYANVPVLLRSPVEFRSSYRSGFHRFSLPYKQNSSSWSAPCIQTGS